MSPRPTTTSRHDGREKMTDEAELEDLSNELVALDGGVIDTCSIVYLTRCGALEPLSSTIELLTVRQVVEEYGTTDLPMRVCDLGAGAADDLVIACARRHGLAVISEDRKLIRRAERLGLRYYNALIMLAMLLLRGRLTHSVYQSNRALLVEAAHYSRRVLRYGEDLTRFILMMR